MALLHFLTVQDVLLFTIGIFFLYILYMSRHFLVFRKMGVKGPTPLPLMGNLLEFFSKGLQKGERDIYFKYKKYGFYGLFEGQEPILIVCDLDAIREISIKQFANFTNHRVFEAVDTFPSTHFLIRMNDDHWKHVRNNLTPAFSTGKLRRMLPLIHDCCEELLEGFQKCADTGKDVEVKTLIGGFTMDVIGRTAFGLQTDTQKNPDNPFVRAAQPFLDFGPVLLISFFLPFLGKVIKFFKYQPAGQKNIDFFSDVTMAALKERQRNASVTHTDFIQLLANAEVNADDEVDEDIDHRQALQTSVKWSNKGLTKEDIIGSAIQFLVAGYETTASTLCFCLHLLALNPECQEKAKQEMDRVLQGGKVTTEKLADLHYLEMCLLETLRLYAPAPRVDRVCNTDTVINGVTIPKGMVINFPASAIHHDPEYWPEPDKFDPERFTPDKKAERHPMSFLAFGAGPRNCIGMRLALMEAKMALVSILQKFKVSPGDQTEHPIKLKKFALTTAENGYWLRVESRKKKVALE